MQIIIYNSSIKVCNQFVQRHKISFQQIRTAQQPGLFDLFVLLAILQVSKTEQYWAAKHILLMGGFLLTGDVLVRVRFRHRRGFFWSTPWVVLVFCCMMSSTVGRFSLGHFGDGPFSFIPVLRRDAVPDIDASFLIHSQAATAAARVHHLLAQVLDLRFEQRKLCTAAHTLGHHTFKQTTNNFLIARVRTAAGERDLVKKT